jgi:hypothetical protein
MLIFPNVAVDLLREPRYAILLGHIHRAPILTLILLVSGSHPCAGPFTGTDGITHALERRSVNPRCLTSLAWAN